MAFETRRPLAIATTFLLCAGCGSAPTDRDATMGSRLEIERGAPMLADGLTVCAPGATLDGIDVSKWQGDINWTQVAGDGIDFAFIRVSDGLSYDDEYFESNWAESRANGVARGAYQFFRSDEDPVAQADYFLTTMGALEPGDLPPVIDVESTDGQTPATIAANVGAWIGHVEAEVGLKPIIYTGRYFWQDNVASAAFADYPLWIAHWGAACPNLPSQWNDWAVWQTSASGSIAGIAGDVDTNVFNGGVAALAAFGSGDPVCGDGWCTGGEDHVSCAEDCPICEPIPPLGRVIDDTDLCFEAGGAPQYIRVVTDAGWNGDLKWTRTWVTATVENYGLWSLEMAEAGLYRVEAFTDAAYAEWTQTPYQIRHAGLTNTLVVDQTAVDGWVEVAEIDFAAGGQQWIRIDDAVSDSGQSGLQILFDAIRLTRLDPPPPPDGAGADGGPGDGGPSGDSAGAGDSDTGSVAGDTTGTTVITGDAVSTGGDHDSDPPSGGCQCDQGAARGGQTYVLGFFLALFWCLRASYLRRPPSKPSVS